MNGHLHSQLSAGNLNSSLPAFAANTWPQATPHASFSFKSISFLLKNKSVLIHTHTHNFFIIRKASTVACATPATHKIWLRAYYRQRESPEIFLKCLAIHPCPDFSSPDSSGYEFFLKDDTYNEAGLAWTGKGGFYVNIPFCITPSMWCWSHWRLHNTGYPLGTDTTVRNKSHPLHFEVTDFSIFSVGFPFWFHQIPQSRLYSSNHTGSFHLRSGMGKWSF